MWLNIAFFIGSCLSNLILRTLLRLEIKKKYWIKQKSGNKVFDWWLLGFREGKRKVWIDLHLAFSIAIPIALIGGFIGFLFKEVEVLMLLPMVVFFLCLCPLACKLWIMPYSPHISKARRIEDGIFGVLFIILMIALSVFLGYDLIKELIF